MAPTYQQLQESLRQSPVVWLDDTGWRVAARPQNLRVLLSEQVTVYAIEPHRGYAEAAAILGEDYPGFLVHDGARCFYGFGQAFHQSCLGHLIRRCREMIQMASPASRPIPLGGQDPAAAEPPIARSLPAGRGFAARFGGGHGAIGSPSGPLAESALSLPGQSATSQTSAP